VNNIQKHVFCAGLFFLSCTQESVFNEPSFLNSYRDKKHVNISSEICLYDDVDSLRYKTHVYVVLDVSYSMQATGHWNDVVKYVEKYRKTYDAEVIVYSNTSKTLLKNEPILSVHGNKSDYILGLNELNKKLERKMAKIPFSQKKYEKFDVVWISDGSFDEDVDKIKRNIESTLLFQTRYNLLLAFHAVWVGTYADSEYAIKSNRLRAFSETGKGFFYPFLSSSDPDVFVLENKKAKKTKLKGISFFYARNIAAFPLKGFVFPDSDYDGLYDGLEIQIGTDPFLKDSDHDFLNDMLEYSILNSDPLSEDKHCLNNENEDHDFDGLSLCEEKYLGSDPFDFDTDEDGFSDGVEAMFRTNVHSSTSLEDVYTDSDLDGSSDFEELWHGTNPVLSDVYARGSTASLYKLMEIENGCYSLKTSYISLADGLKDNKNKWVLTWREKGKSMPKVLCADITHSGGEHFLIPRTRPGDVWKTSKQYKRKYVQACREENDVCDIETTLGECMLDVDICKPRDPCFLDGECLAHEVCDKEHGLCMEVDNQPVLCEDDSFCEKEHTCFQGVCMEKVFYTGSCEKNEDCLMGMCDTEKKWCVPYLKRHFCLSDSECMGGICSLTSGVCTVQSAMPLEDFSSIQHCWRF
jgi:hypothetical protein